MSRWVPIFAVLSGAVSFGLVLVRADQHIVRPDPVDGIVGLACGIFIGGCALVVVQVRCVSRVGTLVAATREALDSGHTDLAKSRLDEIDTAVRSELGMRHADLPRRRS